MPQLELSTYASQVFWLVVCFGMLCVFMGTFIAPRIGLSLHQRAKTLEEQAETAKKLLEDMGGNFKEELKIESNIILNSKITINIK